MSIRVCMSCVLLLVLLAVGARAGVSAVPGGAHVEPAVLAQLAEAPDGRTSVIVALRPVPPGSRAQLDAQQAAVHARQQGVLDALAPGELDLRYRYRAIAALSGHVDVAGLQRLAAHPDVLSIGVNARARGVSDDSVPFVGGDVLHTLGVTGAGTTVAVLDTGIDTDHPDLIDDVAPGAWHFLADGGDVGPGAEDDNGHGTNISGIITGGGVVASSGLAPDTAVLAVKVLDAFNGGWFSDIIAGIDHVVATAGDHPNLCAINMSLGSFDLFAVCPADTETTYNVGLEAACAAAQAAGIACFASSANGGSCGSMSSPAALTSCVAVAAVYDQDLGAEPDAGTYQDAFGASFGDCQDLVTGGHVVTCFSNQSPCSELAAPGRLIDAALVGGGTAEYTGTSMACPHVVALAALVRQKITLTPAELVTVMKDTGDATTDGCGSGPDPISINALAALESVPWTDVLTGTPGITVPTLSASGLTIATATVDWDLGKLPPLSTTFLVIGLSELSAPFKGGTLVPAPDLVLPLPSGPGTIPISFPWPAGVPPGTRIWLQAWTPDPFAVQGFSATNAVIGTAL